MDSHPANRTIEFCGLDVEVTPDVLRPYKGTERLVRHAISLEPAWFCDVGTGSGNIVVTMLVNLPKAKAIAVDISPAALLVARRNAEKHGVADRVAFVCGDALSGINAEFDLITCNPPYHETTTSEPAIAITDGQGGMSLTRKLLKHRTTRLLVECGRTQTDILLKGQRGWAFRTLAGPEFIDFF